jgi:hypothetical protein
MAGDLSFLSCTCIPSAFDTADVSELRLLHLSPLQPRQRLDRDPGLGSDLSVFATPERQSLTNDRVFDLLSVSILSMHRVFHRSTRYARSYRALVYFLFADKAV